MPQSDRNLDQMSVSVVAPPLPAVVDARWFQASAAAYLGAVNLAGYLAGALLAGLLSSRMPMAVALRGMMLVAVASFFACALRVSFVWFFLWRFASGFAGGALMVLAAPTVLPHVPAARRGVASGVIFMGVGPASRLPARWCLCSCSKACAKRGSAWGRWRCSRRSSRGEAGRPRPRPRRTPTLRSTHIRPGAERCGPFRPSTR
jgi:Uncharacterised MFS-type transporter YbfB